MMMNNILEKLDIMIPNPRCELEYHKDYELLIATVLSAQCTDARVNMVTKELFAKYDIFSLATADIEDIKKIIKPVGTFTRKSLYIKEIAIRLVKDYNGTVPNDRKYLESLPGVGRKTCNVVLSNIYNVPAIAVDTHVKRLSNRIGFSNAKEPQKIEQDLLKLFPKKYYYDANHILIWHGRNTCKSQKPNCENCCIKHLCKSCK